MKDHSENTIQTVVSSVKEWSQNNFNSINSRIRQTQVEYDFFLEIQSSIYKNFSQYFIDYCFFYREACCHFLKHYQIWRNCVRATLILYITKFILLRYRAISSSKYNHKQQSFIVYFTGKRLDTFSSNKWRIIPKSSEPLSTSSSWCSKFEPVDFPWSRLQSSDAAVSNHKHQ